MRTLVRGAEEYGIFDGDHYQNLMPQLKGAGFRPSNMADAMKRGLEALNTRDTESIDFWFNMFLHTSDGIANNRDKRKLVPDVRQLIDITPNAGLLYKDTGPLVITPDEYLRLEAEELSLNQLERAGLQRNLRYDEVPSHPFWQASARGDTHLLREVRDAVFAEIKRKYSASEGMAIYLSPHQRQPSIRALIRGTMESGAYASDGDYLAIYAYPSLVGIRPKTAERDIRKPTDALEILVQRT